MSRSTVFLTKRLQGKTALVTGAGAGIGRCVALRFAAEGATVLAASRSDNVETLRGEADGEIVPLRCDVSDPAQVAATVAACRERFGRLDVLVNTAGIAQLHELGLDNIRCNSVAPGVTLTPLVRSAPSEVIAPKIAATPQGRAAEPEEVASLALFLASDEASHITGGLYLIDGGRSAL